MKNKKKKLKKILFTGLVFLAFFALLYCACKVLMPKYITKNIEGSLIDDYYESTFDHDVIFIGDCEVYSNISPATIYEKSHLTSFVRGTAKQSVSLSYYILEETLSYETPKVVVFNVLNVTDKETSEAYNHLTLDRMKFGKYKLLAIENAISKDEKMFDYLLPALYYNERIFSLKKEDFTYAFKNDTKTFAGYLKSEKVEAYTALPTPMPLPNYNLPKENLEYLKKMVDLCKRHDVRFIMVKAPTLYPYWYEEWDAQLAEFAKENDVTYYNFLDSQIGIDYMQDTSDGGMHLNYSGAKKYSEYLVEKLLGKVIPKEHKSSTIEWFENLVIEEKS